MIDPNTNPNNNDVYTDEYEGDSTIILYTADDEQVVLVKDE